MTDWPPGRSTIPLFELGLRLEVSIAAGFATVIGILADLGFYCGGKTVKISRKTAVFGLIFVFLQFLF